MSRYLPDTNLFIAWTARDDARAAAWMLAHRSAIDLSIVVAHELYFGAFLSAKVDRNLREIDALGLPLLPFDREDALAAGNVRAQLRRTGTPIGPYDVLIAGQALARDLTVVTANVAEFARVVGLKLVDWSRA